MINIIDTLRQRNERRRANELEYMSKQYAYSRDNIIYVAGVPIYTIADREDGEWVKTPSQAAAYITTMRERYIKHGGSEHRLV